MREGHWQPYQSFYIFVYIYLEWRGKILLIEKRISFCHLIILHMTRNEKRGYGININRWRHCAAFVSIYDEGKTNKQQPLKWWMNSSALCRKQSFPITYITVCAATSRRNYVNHAISLARCSCINFCLRSFFYLFFFLSWMMSAKAVALTRRDVNLFMFIEI